MSKQAERYEQGLRHAIDIIADNPRIAVERQEYAPRCGCIITLSTS